MPQRKAVFQIASPVAEAVNRSCLAGIRIYQRYLSPLKAPSCRFYPSCSQYCYDAVKKYGTLRGSALGIRRLLKCHPFHPGGYDPVK